jgi:hypothetical protein
MQIAFNSLSKSLVLFFHNCIYKHLISQYTCTRISIINKRHCLSAKFAKAPSPSSIKLLYASIDSARNAVNLILGLKLITFHNQNVCNKAVGNHLIRSK